MWEVVPTGGGCLKHPLDCAGAEFPPFGGALAHQPDPFISLGSDRRVGAWDGQRQGPPCCPAVPAGCASPTAAGTGSEAAERQRRAQPRAFLVLVSPAPSWLSRALAGEGTPRHPKPGGMEGAGHPLHTKVPKTARQLPRAGRAWITPCTAPGGCPRVLHAPGANSSSFPSREQGGEQYPLAKGGNVLKSNKTTVRPSLTASSP